MLESMLRCRPLVIVDVLGETCDLRANVGSEVTGASEMLRRIAALARMPAAMSRALDWEVGTKPRLLPRSARNRTRFSEGPRQRQSLLKTSAHCVRVTLAALVLFGCGHGSNLQGRYYEQGDLAFHIGRTPDAWRPIETDTALIAFRDDERNATIAVNGRCGQDGDDVPLVALTHHLFLHFTDRRVISQSTVRLDGREALRTELSAKLDGVPKHFVVYVLKKDGCVYDFLQIAAMDSSDSVRDDFDRFVSEFRSAG